tara:strand:+ start:1064 stop:1336 length:273 start_codon:yes stop_codon:yes gene_type:complete
VAEFAEYYRMVAWERCPWCIKAQALLEEQGAEVHVVYYERGTQELQEAKQRNDWQTVPMITHVSVHGEDIKETFVGGYDNLCRFVGKSGE